MAETVVWWGKEWVWFKKNFGGDSPQIWEFWRMWENRESRQIQFNNQYVGVFHGPKWSEIQLNALFYVEGFVPFFEKSSRSE